VTSTLPDLPTGWRVVSSRGPAGFVTHARLARPDGSEVEWTSRRHRKGLGLRLAGARADGGRASASSWWIGSLFAVGSVCFALGSVPWYVEHVAADLVGATFFVGSIFFTAAAYLQLHETLRAPGGVLAQSPRPGRLASLVGWKPHRIDFWAGVVQLVGTMFFNISTFAATRADLSTVQDRHLVWAPDVVGSVCFLVASWLAYAEVNRGILPRPDRSVGWRIAALNLLGSVAFGVAALAARYLRSTGELANLALVNLGTFVGAVCFLVGAVLLPVESATERSSG
jgi:predicted membrane protein